MPFYNLSTGVKGELNITKIHLQVSIIDCLLVTKNDHHFITMWPNLNNLCIYTKINNDVNPSQGLNRNSYTDLRTLSAALNKTNFKATMQGADTLMHAA